MSETYRIGDPVRIKSVTFGAFAVVLLVSREAKPMIGIGLSFQR